MAKSTKKPAAKKATKARKAKAAAPASSEG